MTPCRELIHFCEDICATSQPASWLLSLKKSLKRNRIPTGEIILFYESQQFGLRRAYLKNLRFHEETAQKPWPQTKRLADSNSSTQLYIAEEMGRPFSSLLAVPLLLDEPEGSHRPMLFIEWLKKHKTNLDMQDFFTERLSLLNLTLRKVLFHTKASRTSITWNSVFENWGEGLAIVHKNQLVKSNAPLKKLVQKHPYVLEQAREKKKLEIEDKSYQLHSSSISIGKKSNPQTYFLYLQDLTRYFSLKEELLQGEKIAVLGTLGKNLAHEILNPLAGILSMSQILQRDKEYQDAIEELESIEQAILRAQDIIANFLRFSRAQNTEKQTCDLNQVIKETLPLLKSLSKDVSIQLELEKDSPPLVYGNISSLGQIIFNLVGNACQACLASTELKLSAVRISTQVKNNQVVLEIKDNGIGIDKKNLEKIFQPLWTTKKQGEGTGLGLGISKRFISDMQASIHVQSELKVGSSFTITFPLNEMRQESCLPL